MARGKPDFSPNNPRNILNSVDELASVIVGLGGNAGFNRDGITLYSDDFDKGLAPYIASNSGTGSAVALDTGESYLGKQSVKLTSGTDSGRLASLLKRLAPFFGGIVRYEMFFTAIADIASVQLSLAVRVLEISHSGVLTLDFDQGKIFRLNSAGGNTEIGTFDWADDGNPFWHVISVAINLDSLEYADIKLDNTTFDLSGAGLLVSASAFEDSLGVTISVASIATENAIINVDAMRVSVS